jgi:hypothetical protein
MAVLGTAYLSWVLGPNLRSLLGVVENPAAFAATLLGMALLWGTARRANASAAKHEQAEIRFEEEEPPAVQGLGLTFDGPAAMDPTSGR